MKILQLESPLVCGDVVYVDKEPRCPENEYRIIDYSRQFIGRQNLQHLRPGIYRDMSYVILSSVKNNRIRVVSIHCLQLIEKFSKKRRASDVVDENKRLIYQGELPETKFWEGDLVRLIDQPNGVNYRVDTINYAMVSLKNMSGKKYDVYRVTNGRTTLDFSEDQLELVERGSAWKDSNNQSATLDNKDLELPSFACVS